MPYFSRNPADWEHLDGPPELPAPITSSLADPIDYVASEELEAAVNVALMLGQPLLLTGKPGVGKTALAHAVGAGLDLGAPLKFEVKSTTEARDLFYQFDALARFRDARADKSTDNVRDYLAFQGLGLALLRTLAPDDPLVERYWNTEVSDAFEGPRRSVVLIDEIDKAPRDVPNDILNEIELGYFRIAEDRFRKVAGSDDLRPVVILTSNSEKHLPDAFLRRCVYHHIDFPDRKTLRKIAVARVKRLQEPNPLGDDMIEEVLDLFDGFRRKERALRKAPSTAEMLAALMVLRRDEFPLSGSLREDHGLCRRLLHVLVKDQGDLEQGLKILKAWQSPRSVSA